MGSLKGGQSLASWLVAGTITYFLWAQDLKKEQQECGKGNQTHYKRRFVPNSKKEVIVRSSEISKNCRKYRKGSGSLGLVPLVKFSMAEYPRMKCNFKLPWDDEAIVKKFMEDTWVRFSVEGYNTSLPADDMKKALSSHFSSCGEIWSVVVPTDPGCAYIVIHGDGSVQDKALKLDGSDLGGCNLTVKVAPKKYKEATPQQLDAMTKLLFDKKYMFGISVRGYDTSLPDDDVKSALRAYFASSGDITHVSVNTLDSRAYVYFSGKEALDKALEPDASDLRGWKLVVRALPGINPGPGIGYTIQPHCIEMTKEIWAMK